MQTSWPEDARRALLEERLVGYLDPGAERYLLQINEGGLRTTSSCTGRITVVEGRWHWLRDGARIVYKAHREVEPSILAMLIARPFDDLWLKVTGPILHVRLPDVECVPHVLEASREAGFKHSGAISVKEEVVVELMSAVQISFPLKMRGKVLVDPRSLRDLVEEANEALRDGWARLERLSALLSRLDCRQRT